MASTIMRGSLQSPMAYTLGTTPLRLLNNPVLGFKGAVGTIVSASMELIIMKTHHAGSRLVCPDPRLTRPYVMRFE